MSYSKSVRSSVRPSVCLSHASVVSKWLKLRSWGLHWRTAHDYFLRGKLHHEGTKYYPKRGATWE